MNEWDGKIYRDSIARDLCPGGFEDEKAFTIGARWQREALLADDVIERAARRIYRHQLPESLKCLMTQWEEAHEVQRDHFRSVARAALMAALGIEGDE